MRTPRWIAVIGGVLVTAGAATVGASVGAGLHSTKAPAMVANAYAEAAACAACPAGTHLDSVEVQARQGSTLFILSGGWPASIDKLQVSVCLNTNGTRITLKPHGTRNLFEPAISTASSSTASAPQLQAVGTSLQSNYLLVNLAPPVQPSAPLTFDVALCSGGSTVERLPSTGELRWTGSGSPKRLGTAPTATPTPTAAPTAPLSGPDPTALVSACSAIPTGTVPASLQVTGTSSGVKPDPRSQAPTQSVSAALGATPVGVTAPFAIVAVILPQGAGTALPQKRLIDLAGTEQIYAYFDGQKLHKALRTFQNGAWTTVIDSAANVISFALGGAPPGAAFFWSGIHPGDKFAFITASASGCSSSGLDSTLMPTLTVAG
jgi:hypothetical protein